jgi:hypothetical protein
MNYFPILILIDGAGSEKEVHLDTFGLDVSNEPTLNKRSTVFNLKSFSKLPIEYDQSLPY